MFVFVTGSYPFDSDSELELQMFIINKNLSFPNDFNPQLKILISNILNRDFNARPSLKEILEDKYFST